MNVVFKYGFIYIKNKKFLVNRKAKTSYFIVPGGQPEGEESPLECLSREMLEEHGVNVVEDSLGYIERFQDTSIIEPDTLIVMGLYYEDIIGNPKPDSEIEEQAFVGRHDNYEFLSPIIKRKIIPELIRMNLI